MLKENVDLYVPPATAPSDLAGRAADFAYQIKEDCGAYHVIVYFGSTCVNEVLISLVSQKPIHMGLVKSFCQKQQINLMSDVFHAPGDYIPQHIEYKTAASLYTFTVYIP